MLGENIPVSCHRLKERTPSLAKPPRSILLQQIEVADVFRPPFLRTPLRLDHLHGPQSKLFLILGGPAQELLLSSMVSACSLCSAVTTHSDHNLNCTGAPQTPSLNFLAKKIWAEHIPKNLQGVFLYCSMAAAKVLVFMLPPGPMQSATTLSAMNWRANSKADFSCADQA